MPSATNTELERLVRADLMDLAESWNDFPDEMLVRRWSAALRRLLADGQPTLATYRKERGFGEEARIKSIDLEAALGPDFATATLACTGGIQMAGMIIMLPCWSTAPLANPRGVLFPTQTYKLSRYLATTGMVVNGNIVTRRQVIRYVANKLGGVHYDPSRKAGKPEEQIFAQLDKARPRMDIGNTHLDLVHLEIVSIGQHLLRSPDIIKMFPNDLPAAREIPNLDEIIGEAASAP